MPTGRPNVKYSQALRILKIYEMLQHRGAITIGQLMEEFGIDRRTVQRDLAVLSEAYSIQEGERTANNEKTFRLTASVKQETIKLTVSEMIAFYMGRNLFRFAEGTEIKKAIDSVYNKLQTRLSQRNAHIRSMLPRKFYCTNGYPKDYKRRDDVLNELLTGLINTQKIKFSYQSPGKKAHSDILQPYTLVLHNSALYVYGYAEQAGDARMFALERFSKAKWLSGQGFDYPSDHDPERKWAGAFGVAVGVEPQPVTLRFGADASKYVGRRKWHPSMQTKRRGKELEVRMDVGLAEDFVHWVVGYGGEVSVLEPKELRFEVAKRHKQGAKANS